jgi:hypothetical protein
VQTQELDPQPPFLDWFVVPQLQLPEQLSFSIQSLITSQRIPVAALAVSTALAIATVEGNRGDNLGDLSSQASVTKKKEKKSDKSLP